jgi:uncharacterized membrane protein
MAWFSLLLGASELLAPQRVARLTGLPESDRVMATLRGFGARQIGNGIAILQNPDRAAWRWARVGGDALDLSCLASSMRAPGATPARLGAAIATVLAVTAIDIRAAAELSGEPADYERRRVHRVREVRVERAITINRAIEDVYRFWRRLENLPRFLRHLESVEVLDDRRSRWRAAAPAGMTVSWEAEIVAEREPERIAWRSLDGSQIRNSGTVRFARAPGARGTEVHVQLMYAPPAGALGRAVAWMFGEEPDQQIKEDLRRVKQLLEVGEIPVSDGPSLRRPAQPAVNPDDIRALQGVRGVSR